MNLAHAAATSMATRCRRLVVGILNTYYVRDRATWDLSVQLVGVRADRVIISLTFVGAGDMHDITRFGPC